MSIGGVKFTTSIFLEAFKLNKKPNDDRAFLQNSLIDIRCSVFFPSSTLNEYRTCMASQSAKKKAGIFPPYIFICESRLAQIRFEGFASRGMSQSASCFLFYLTNTFSGEIKFFTNFFECHGLVVVQPKV